MQASRLCCMASASVCIGVCEIHMLLQPLRSSIYTKGATHCHATCHNFSSLDQSPANFGHGRASLI